MADDDTPPWLADFVIDLPTPQRERHGRWDLFPPEVDEPAPLVVFVHGGPIPPDLVVPPRDWPVFRGYGALAAAQGFVGLTVDHRLHDLGDLRTAFEDVRGAIHAARDDERVDADRVAVWVFSGGGPMVAPLLSEPPAWLRSIGATYPILDSRPHRELPAAFRPVDALARLGRRLPFVLTRVGLEAPETAETVDRFVDAAAGTDLDLTVVDHPTGHHGFDALDYGAESERVVMEAFRLVARCLT